QGAQELDAAPFGKGGERAMRRAADKINSAVAQRLVSPIDRKDQLGRDFQPLALEKPELGRGQGRKIRIRDQIRYREPHAPLPFCRPPTSLSSAQQEGNRARRRPRTLA